MASMEEGERWKLRRTKTWTSLKSKSSFTSSSSQPTNSSVDLNPIDSRPRGRFRTIISTRWRAWHLSVSAGASLAFLVLAINIGVLLWAQSHSISSTNDGLLQIFIGNCSHANKIVTWSHLGINVLSTMLLYASSTGMELASAPSREEVDEAHAKGYGVDIGILSMRNLTRVRPWKVAAWLALAVSSLPLHLLYNSVIFSTTSGNDITYLLVASDFPEGASFNRSSYLFNTASPYISGLPSVKADTVSQMQESAPTLTWLSRPDCIRTFLNPFVSQYRFALLVADTPSTGDSLYSTIFSNASAVSDDLPQLCATSHLPTVVVTDASDKCDFNAQKQDTSEWRLPITRDVSKPLLLPEYAPITQSARHGVPTANVDHCLALPTDPQCTVRVSRSLLIPVIFCNAIKWIILCLLALKRLPSDPLVTVGDAVASFLARPDASFSECGPASAKFVRNACSNGIDYAQLKSRRPWKQKKHLFFSAPSLARCISTVASAACLWIASAALLSTCAKSSIPTWFTFGLEAINSSYMISFTREWSLPAIVTLVNLPQVLVSMIYLSYYSIMAAMLEAQEFASFSLRRRPLRVSHPQGDQYCTWWLQLPFKYALPLMALLALLHWLISESLFLVQVTVTDIAGVPQSSEDLNGCGWSPMAVFLSLIVGFVVVVALFVIGFRRLPAGAPLVECCSISIAVACAKIAVDERGDREKLARKPLRYGVIVDGCPEKHGVDGRVGFTSGFTRPLVDGETYE